MPVPQPQLDPIDAFGSLHRQLTRALLASTDIAAVETMRHADAAMVQAITALNRADFHTRTAEFRELGATVKGQLVKLKELKEDLEKIVDNVELAGKIAGAIDSAVSAAAAVFPIP